MARKRKRDDGGAPQTEIDREEELFIQEVNEELKQERYLQTWKKYGQYIVGCALLAVGSVAGWQWYKDSIRSAQESQSVEFASAAALAAGGKSGEAGKILDKLARETDGGYAVLARLKQAALVGKSGDSKSAATLYLQLADDDRISPVFRELGTVLWGLHALDSAGPDQAIARLTPLGPARGPRRYTTPEHT
ncbi:MAG: tetratricopeptide repeat protein, partial [Rhodospirillaceae bacterium]|nr:tetratricopeptide repeat protein [Rhodospirillaceae bacterium]